MTSTTFPTGQTTERTAADYVDVLKRYWFVLIVTTVLSTIITTGFALTQKKVYESSTDILLEARFSDSVVSGRTPGSVNLSTQVRVITGGDVAIAVAEKLALNIGEVPRINAIALGDTSVIRISVRNTDPNLAVSVVTAAADAYIDLRRQNAIDDLTAAATEVQARIDAIQQEYRGLDPASTDQVVTSRRYALMNQESAFRTQLSQLQLTAALRTGEAQVIVAAQTPTSPVAPNPERSAIIGFMLGLMAGIALAFLIDFSDKSIPDSEVLGAVLPGAAILASVPLGPDWTNETDEDSFPIAAQAPAAQCLSRTDPCVRPSCSCPSTCPSRRYW